MPPTLHFVCLHKGYLSVIKVLLPCFEQCRDQEAILLNGRSILPLASTVGTVQALYCEYT